MGIHKHGKTPPVLAAAVTLIFLTVCAYAGVHVWEHFNRDYETSAVSSVSLKDSIHLRGIAVRREQVICSPMAENELPSDGDKLSAKAVEAFDVPLSGSALFFKELDGFEYLCPEDFCSMQPSELQDILSRKPDRKKGRGRLVSGFDWYFAALAEDSSKIPQEGSCRLCFEATGGELPARLVNISSPEKGKLLLLFRLNQGGEEYMSLRKTEAELIFSRYSGLLLPVKAVRTDEDGNEYVYTLTAGKPERRAVEIIYKFGESCIAAESPAADGLREGNLLIISAKNEKERMA